jgi:hypothetical protein
MHITVAFYIAPPYDHGNGSIAGGWDQGGDVTEKTQHRSERIQRSDSGSRYAKCRIDREGNLIVADPALARKFNRSGQRQTLLAFLRTIVSAFSDVDPMYGPVVPSDEF